MISMPETLPDDPILLKQLLLSASVQMSEKDGQIERLREQNALLIQRLFGRKSEQSSDPDSPQLEIFNEAESLPQGAHEAFEFVIRQERRAAAAKVQLRQRLP